MFLTFIMKCEYVSLSLYINEDRIPADVPRCWALWDGSPKPKKWAGRHVKLPNRK